MTTENQETPEQGLTFPIKVDKCPYCGSTRRVAEMVRDEEVAKGKLPKDLSVVAMQAVTPVTEMKTILLGLSIVPVLTFQFDQCVDCNGWYAISTSRQDMPTGDLQKMMGIVPQPQPQQTFGFRGLPRQQRRNQ